MDNAKTTPQAEVVPFDGIGLCFSGGGYRATFFDLGATSYLNKIQYEGRSLLSRVIAISTVSGGTLFGVAFAKAAQSASFDFEEFYAAIFNTFTPENDTLLNTAINKLENDDVWKQHPYKKRSIINAFALTYAEMDIYKGSFEMFKKPVSSSLKHVCFNSTEFSFGLYFRFQNSGVFGNSALKTKALNDVKYDIQLGDIVASSSCFPMGFEPLVFPDDYFENHEDPNYKALKALPYFDTGIGIMDGGIADNQGIKSMLNISEQKAVKNHFNLLIVNDVSSYKMAPWEQDTEKIKDKTSLRNTLGRILSYLGLKPIYWITLLLGIGLLIVNYLELIGNSLTALYIIGGMITGIGLMLTIGGYLLGKEKRKTISWIDKKLKQNVPEELLDDVISFDNLEIGLIKRMLVDRATSTFKMVYDIFLKQIRRLNYEILYEMDDLKYKRITSTVYELNGKKSHYKNHRFNPGFKTKPSKALTESALIASETPTVLWWSKKDKDVDRMRNLIACGQFTTCYSLMNYILDLKEDGITSPELEDLFKVLETDWKSFNKNPLQWVKPNA